METMKVTLINPWTHQPTERKMTWAQIYHWAKENVHFADFGDWLKAARVAFNADDGATLGKMIIGS